MRDRTKVMIAIAGTALVVGGTTAIAGGKNGGGSAGSSAAGTAAAAQAFGVAVNATTVPVFTFVVHVAPQLIPPTSLVIVPVPVPDLVTVSADVNGTAFASASTHG